MAGLIVIGCLAADDADGAAEDAKAASAVTVEPEAHVQSDYDMAAAGKAQPNAAAQPAAVDPSSEQVEAAVGGA